MEKTFTTTMKPSQVIVDREYLRMLESTLLSVIEETERSEIKYILNKKHIYIYCKRHILPILYSEIPHFKKLLEKHQDVWDIPETLKEQVQNNS